MSGYTFGWQSTGQDRDIAMRELNTMQQNISNMNHQIVLKEPNGNRVIVIGVQPPSTEQDWGIVSYEQAGDMLTLKGRIL